MGPESTDDANVERTVVDQTSIPTWAITFRAYLTSKGQWATIANPEPPAAADEEGFNAEWAE